MSDKPAGFRRHPLLQAGRVPARGDRQRPGADLFALEVIVVNDGSPDDTEKVAHGYGDRIVYIHRPNGGLSAARNTGIARARGRYFKFLDSDDYLHPEQIEWQMEALAGREDCASLTATRLFRDGKPEEYLDHVPQATALLPDLFRDYDWGAPLGLAVPGGAGPRGRRLRRVAALRRGLGLLHQTRPARRDAAGGQARRLLLPPAARFDERQPRRHGDRPRPHPESDCTTSCAQTGRPDWFGLDLLKVEQGGLSGAGAARVKTRVAGRAAAPHPRVAEARRLRPVRLALPADGARARLRPRRTAAGLRGAGAEDQAAGVARHPGLEVRDMSAADGQRRHPGLPRRPHHRPGGRTASWPRPVRLDEILVVDDGSPDDLAAALAPYGDRVRLLRKANGGAASARNFGMDRCGGDLHRLPRRRRLLGAGKAGTPAGRAGNVIPRSALVAGRFYIQDARRRTRSLNLAGHPSLFDRVWDRPPGPTAFEIARRIWTSVLLVRRDGAGRPPLRRRAWPPPRTSICGCGWCGPAPVYLAVGTAGDGRAGGGVAVARRPGPATAATC